MVAAFLIIIVYHCTIIGHQPQWLAPKGELVVTHQRAILGCQSEFASLRSRLDSLSALVKLFDEAFGMIYLDLVFERLHGNVTAYQF